MANEIRRLSEATTINSKEIANSLKKLINSIYASKEKTDATGVQFNILYDGVEKIIDSMTEIRDGLQELTTAGSQTLTSFSLLTQSSVMVKDATSGMVEKIRNVKKSWESVNAVSYDNRQSLDEFLVGLKEIEGAILSIMSTGQKNLENVTSIQDLTDQFRTESREEGAPNVTGVRLVENK